MKKSTRILSVILALTMLLGIFSVMGSAYQAYRGSAITGAAGYDDLDKPKFTTEQYASMALEELEKLLAKSNIKLSPDDLLNLTEEGLDLTSINKAIASVGAIYTNVSGLLSIAGDAKNLSIDALYVGHNRNGGNGTLITRGATGNTSDTDVILAVVQFLEDNKGILTSYVGHTLQLGALTGLVGDYLFDVRQLAFKALYHLMNDEFDILDGDINEVPYNVAENSGDLDALLGDLLNYALFGNHKLVGGSYVLPNPEDYEGFLWEYIGDLPTATITQIINDCNIVNTTTNAYDFIEKLILNAFNYIAVPLLNDVTRPWLRETCGVVYDKSKVNNPDYPNYDGEPYEEGDLDPQLAAIFDVEGMHIPAYNASDYASGTTFISNFNTYFGTVLECVLNGSAAQGDWVWDNSQGDKLLLKNICSVAKWILKQAGDKFFEPYISVPGSAEIEGWNEQQTVAFVLRVILNESVSWMYIDDNQQTIADVCYAAVEQLAWQDLPQLTYTKPVKTGTDAEYYSALVDQMLDILMDIAAYNINQNIDMVVGSNGKAKNRTASSPASNAGSGLLEYSNNYELLAVQIATWAVHNYAGMLTAQGCTFENINTDPNNNGTVGGVTAAQVWADVDTIINALIPIKGNGAWIHGDIANQNLVIKSLLFDFIINPILNINDISNVEKILSRNTSGALATNTVKKALLDVVVNVVNAIFPGTTGNLVFNDFDGLVVNSKLAVIIGNLIDSLHAHAADWVNVALPVVCDLLDLTDAQSFGEMECYMPEIVSVADAASMSFQVYNGCSGINTGYTSATGAFQQDQLYVYDITGVTATSTSGSVGINGLSAGQTLDGGAAKTITLAGSNIVKDSIITLTIRYKVKNETGGYLAGGKELACTRYCYVDTTDKDDSDNRVDSAAGNGYTLKAAPSVYANKGRSLSDALGYAVAVKDDAGGQKTLRISNVSTSAEWIELNPEAVVTTDADAGMTYTVNPFKVKDGYVRLDESYNRANVNSSNFATYGSTEEGATARAIDLYTRNANGYTYTKVSQSAQYDATETYYTYNTNVAGQVNGKNVDEAGNIVIGNGGYTATFTLTTPTGSATKTVAIFLYDDKGLASLYNNAVDANRQSDQFTNANTEFNNYKSALDAAGLLVLDPKTVAEFPNKLSQYPTAYANLYQAITALDAKAATTGVDDLKEAIAGFVANQANAGENYSNNYYFNDASQLNSAFLADGNEPETTGWNNVQYWATAANKGTDSRYAYSYFGVRDFVAHDYKKFRDARNSAQGIIDSQIVYPPVEPVNPGANASVYEYNKYQEELAAYNEAYTQYIINEANIPALNSVSVAYALSMVNLTGSRLIPLDADKSKLSAFRTTYKVDSQGNYSASTWKEYSLAKTFADYTLADSSAVPSQVTEALSQYVRAYKRLCNGVDYTNLDAAIIDALAVLGRSVSDVAAVISTLDSDYSDVEEIVATLTAQDYTEASARAFATALVEGIDLRADDLGDSTANENAVDTAAAKLAAATNGLEIAAAGDPVIEFFDPDTDPDAYDEYLARGVFMRDDFAVTFVPYLENTYSEMYFEDQSVNFIAGVGSFYYDGEPTDVFMNLENCYAVWTDNEGNYSTGSYITIYTDENCETEIATYYIMLYGDFDGDAEIGTLDGLALRANVDEYMWDGDPVHFAMACAGDVDGDTDTGTLDAMIIKQVASGTLTINQDYDNHWSEGDTGPFEEV